MDWLDLLAVQGTLKSLLQHHNSKASTLWRSAFFIVQLSHPCMTTGKTIALTRQTFVGKVMSLLFNMLSRLVVTLLPRSKHLSMRYSKCHDCGRCVFYLSLAALGLHCCTWAFSSCGGPGLLSRCGARACYRGGSSCFGARALGRVGFSSCGTQA